MSGNETFIAGLQRVAALHGELARVYEDLARDSGIALAELAEQSVTPAVLMTSTTTPKHRTSNDESMVTTKELAEVLNCHTRTVRRLELAGRIPKPIGEGRLKRWHRKDITELLEEGFAQN